MGGMEKLKKNDNICHRNKLEIWNVFDQRLMRSYLIFSVQLFVD